MRVRHLPEGVHLEGTGRTVAPSGSSTYKRWTGANGAVVSLTALRGTGARTLDGLAAWARLGEEQVRAMREVTVHGTAGYTGEVRYEGRRWHVHLWRERPGLGFLLMVSAPLAGEPDRIREGIVPAETRVTGEHVDGVAVTRLPAGLTRDKSDRYDEGDGWSSVEGRWLDRSGKPGVRVEIARGGAIAEAAWTARTLGPEARETEVGGRRGLLAATGEGARRFLVLSGDVAAVVTVDASLAGELDAIVRACGLPNPEARPAPSPGRAGAGRYPSCGSGPHRAPAEAQVCARSSRRVAERRRFASVASPRTVPKRKRPSRTAAKERQNPAARVKPVFRPKTPSARVSSLFELCQV
jgi:hypothetical protein